MHTSTGILYHVPRKSTTRICTQYIEKISINSCRHYLFREEFYILGNLLLEAEGLGLTEGGVLHPHLRLLH